jgi:hypothetical protein
MGQKMDAFAPVDILIESKRYSEAIDMLRSLLVTAPSRTGAIKDRIARTQLLQADEDITSQRYNEALAELSLFWAQNPEKADQAQKRIRKVNQVREDYNKKAKALLAYMGDAKNRTDPDYNKNVIARLQELDDLDRNNPDSKKTITSLKETSLALVNQDKMRALMSSGRALIDKGEYAKATRAYLQGFALFKPEFENAGYDELTMSAVASEVKQAEAIPEPYEALQSRLEATGSELDAAFAKGDPAAVQAALPAAQAVLEELRSIREAAFAVGSSLSRAYDAIPKADKSPIEYQYLAYLDLFVRGRPDSLGEDKKPQAEKGLPEGVGGVLLAQTELLLSARQKAAEAAVDSAIAEAERDFASGSYTTAQASFARAAALVAPSLEALANWAKMPEKDFVPELASLRGAIAKGASASGRLSQLALLAASEARLSGIAAEGAKAAADSSAYAARVGDGAGGVALAEARAALDGYRAAMRALAAREETEKSGLAALKASAAQAALPLGDDRPVAAVAAFSGRLDKAASEIRAAESALATARAGLEAGYIQRELGARTAAVAGAEARIEGQASKLPERARAGYRDPEASAAALALASEERKVAELASWIEGDLASMSTEAEDFAATPGFASARAKVENQGAKAKELEARRAAALAKALERKKAAASALAGAKADMNAARARLSDARAQITQDKGKGAKAAAIKKGFADARDRLEKGLNGIIESANADFDAKAWDDYQKLYASLNDDLTQAKKDYTIGETFRLLAEGQTYYEQALFDLAGESLSTAQELWREDNDADQEQVKYWQNLVRQASDTNNKREVRQSDALYYEIGSYLSEARKLYLKGDGLMKSGRKADAAAAFESARQSISFVTRAFPLNAEAGLLTLQILKSTDAEAYKKSLPRRIQEAIELLATDSSSGYSRIADLYKMEPSYPGLKAALEKAEIKVGKRRAPPTKDELAQSASFVAQAEKLLKTGRKDDAAKAESALNAALTYEPTNKRAFALLRDLKTLQGKSAGPILGLADKAVLDQATRAFASSQYNQARDTLLPLLSDPDKRTREVLKLDNDLKTLGY